MNGKLESRKNNHFIFVLQVIILIFFRSLLMLEDPGKLLMMAGLFAHNYEKQVIARCVKLVCVDVFIYHNNHKFKGHHGRCAFKNACMFHTTS